jgi:hypothetical protein
MLLCPKLCKSTCEFLVMPNIVLSAAQICLRVIEILLSVENIMSHVFFHPNEQTIDQSNSHLLQSPAGEGTIGS